MRITNCLSILLLIFVANCVHAQSVREERGSLGGSVGAAFKRAAEKQGRNDWPIKGSGRPGTAIRLTFDPRNADAHLFTDRSYGEARLLKTLQTIAREIDLPRTDFILEAQTERAVSVEMEFNRHLVFPDRTHTRFDFDLSRFADALRRSDLPRPIVFGIRPRHSRLNRVSLTTVKGTRPLTEITFLGLVEVSPGTVIHWNAEIAWTGYLFAAAFLMTMVFMAGSLVFQIGRRKRPMPPAAPDPEKVQKAYDRLPPLTILIGTLPLLMVTLMLTGNLIGSMESMLYLVPSGMLMALAFVVPLMVLGGLTLLVVVMKRSRLGGADPIDADLNPPIWTRVAPMFGLLPAVLLLALLVMMLPYWNPLRAMPLAFRKTAPVWLPIALLCIGFLPALIAQRLASRVTRRRLKPGDLWHDRVMALAHKTNVPVKRVIELWTATPNAGATVFGSVILTRGLLRRFEPEEVDCVIAHELGHHTYRHPRRTLIVSLLFTAVVIGGWTALTRLVSDHAHLSDEQMVLFRTPLFVLFLLPFIRMYFMGRGQRKREMEADRFAVDAIGDPELVIRALTRIHDLSAQPHRLKPADEAILSHPSLDHRIAAIRDYAAERRMGRDPERG